MIVTQLQNRQYYIIFPLPETKLPVIPFTIQEHRYQGKNFYGILGMVRSQRIPPHFIFTEIQGHLISHWLSTPIPLLPEQ